MKKILVLFIFIFLSFSAFAERSDFICTFKDSYKYKNWRGKIKTDKEEIIWLTGKLSEKKGIAKIRSSFLFGDKKKKKVIFFRTKRAQESKFSYAKYSNKTIVQALKKEWIPTYIRFSLPKNIDRKRFTAYLGYFSSTQKLIKEDHQTSVDLTNEEQKEFQNENLTELEYKLNCRKKNR